MDKLDLRWSPNFDKDFNLKNSYDLGSAIIIRVNDTDVRIHFDSGLKLVIRYDSLDKIIELFIKPE